MSAVSHKRGFLQHWWGVVQIASIKYHCYAWLNISFPLVLHWLMLCASGSNLQKLICDTEVNRQYRSWYAIQKLISDTEVDMRYRSWYAIQKWIQKLICNTELDMRYRSWYVMQKLMCYTEVDVRYKSWYIVQKLIDNNNDDNQLSSSFWTPACASECSQHRDQFTDVS